MNAPVLSRATKCRSLAILLEAVAPHLASGHIAQNPRWDRDERSLGLYCTAEPQLWAYVFTHGQEPGRYAIELGFPAIQGDTAAGVPVTQERLSLAQVIEYLGMHLELPPPV